VIGSAWCVTCALLLYVFPNFPTLVNLWLFDTPRALFEMVLGAWLLVIGLTEHVNRDADSKERIASTTSDAHQ
jgi:hypothetical protein